MISFPCGPVRVDLGDVIVGQLLHLLLRPQQFVFGNDAALGLLFEMLDGVAADMANGDAAILGHFLTTLVNSIRRSWLSPAKRCG